MSTETTKSNDETQLANMFKQSESLLLTLIENSPDVIILRNAEGHLIYVTASIERLLGYAPDEFRTILLFELIHPDNQPGAMQLFTTLLEQQGKSVTTQYRMRHKNGSWRWIEGTWTNLLETPAIKSVMMHLRDITESKQVEAALKQSEEQLRAIFMHTAVGISFTDAQGRILQANPAFLRMIGYTEEELYQTDFQQITHPDDLPENLRLIQELAEGKTSSFVQRKRYRRKDGGEIWVRNTVSIVRDAHGKTSHLIALIEDITESRQAEEERSRLAAIVEASEDAIIGKTPDGIITSWNQAAERMFGYTAEEAIGKHIMLIIPPELHEQENEIISQVRRGIHIQPYETTAVRKDGTRIDVSLSVSPVKDGTGNIVGAAKIVRDITERKELEQRKDEFISMASHELKTPVTSIKGFTQLLQRRFKQRDDEESKRFLSRMDTQLDKLTKLINDLLDVSKMQTGQLEYREEPFELDELVEEIMENIQGSAPHHRLLLEKSVPARVLGDRDRIGQVLINLLTNAIKYSPEADQVIVRIATEGADAVVSVQDFGVGIARSHQKKIFERFYQVGAPEARAYSGLGIGLYISNEIVRRHGGRIWVKSHKGEGSTFSFSLPLFEDSPAR